MRFPGLLLVALAVMPALGGCLGFFDQLNRPDYSVSRTAVVTGPGAWNTDGVFVVQVDTADSVEVTIRARPVPTGVARSTAGLSDFDTAVSMDIPDGTWTISYTVDGYEWETFKEARFDATPPEITGLETLGSAPSGSYVLGEAAFVESGATVRVLRQATGTQVANSLPFTLTGLVDGVHAFDVVASDAAGNEAAWTVQVVAGSATQLPAGQLTMGIVARYSTAAALWDITDLGDYLSPAAAQARAPDYLGSGIGIKPDDPDVQAVVSTVVQPGMTTGEAALALYRWMYDELEYDEARLDKNDLLEPAQTIAADGGVCRDLAALYVSLLRAADVPSRLVAGYLAGRVDGFHAWVEFYGGSGHGPSEWVPVDVSGIDGPYSVGGMLQAFGVRLPEYLMLRAVTPPQEQEEWSSAISLSYTTPPRTPAPDAPFDKVLSDVTSPVVGVLCVDESTRFRDLRNTAQQCTTPGKRHLPDFVTAATRVLDYGIRVESAARGTTLTLEIVYPDTADNSADRVEFAYYAPRTSDGCMPDAATGRATCELRV